MSQVAIEFPSGRWSPEWHRYTEEEAAVVTALRYGRGQAQKVDDLAARLKIAPRHLQEVIARLISEKGVPIGTSMGRKPGNYLIDDPEDLERTYTLLRTRGIRNLTRAAAVRGITEAQLLREIQTELDTGEAA